MVRRNIITICRYCLAAYLPSSIEISSGGHTNHQSKYYRGPKSTIHEKKYRGAYLIYYQVRLYHISSRLITDHSRIHINILSGLINILCTPVVTGAYLVSITRYTTILEAYRPYSYTNTNTVGADQHSMYPRRLRTKMPAAPTL